MRVSDDEIMRQLMSTFKLEADEHLQALNRLLLQLEKDDDPSQAQALLEDIFREAHSLKGAARAVDSGLIEAVSHAVENVFSAAKRREVSLSTSLYDLLYKALDEMSSALDVPAEGGQAPAGQTAGLIEQLNRAAVADSANKAQSPASQSQAKPGKSAAAAKAGNGGTREETIRVSTRKLDSLMTHVEELLVSKIRTEQRLADLKELKSSLSDWQKSWFRTRGLYDRMRRQPTGDLAEILIFLNENHINLKLFWQKTNKLLQDFSKDTMRMSLVTEDLQEDIRHVRMLPVATIFDSYGRMVRDLAREGGKQVELAVFGAETEFDKKVIEGIKDPLMHLIRNSIDHGIESPEARAAQGKPAKGTIWLRASQHGSTIQIEVEDDGGGIDVSRIKNMATGKGMLTQQEAKSISDQEARFLIFQSGFSTAGTVSNVSGRGVGLDVVKKNIEELNGLVSVGTGRAGGAKFTITLPLTLSTSRVLLVNCCGETYALPTSAVERIIRVDRNDIFLVGNKAAINVGDRSLSLVDLGEVLELPSATDDILTGGKVSVIILGAAEKRVAFAVDYLVGETEIVIKSLGKMMSRVRNVSGATLLGSGKVVVILNVSDLIKSARLYKRHLRKKQDKKAIAVEGVSGKKVLVVDDSITTRTLEKNILESAGYSVLMANDGLEAMEILRRSRCDVVISDIDMPRMNGLEFTSKVKNDDDLQDLPVILVTALDSPSDRERGLEAGADAYIVKHSFDQKSLLETIEQLI